MKLPRVTGALLVLGTLLAPCLRSPNATNPANGR